jgi:hypothetical protein
MYFVPEGQHDSSQARSACMCLALVRRPEELCGLGFANLWPEVAKKA